LKSRFYAFSGQEYLIFINDISLLDRLKNGIILAEYLKLEIPNKILENSFMRLVPSTGSAYFIPKGFNKVGFFSITQ
jgi:hypothetical protein